MGIIPIMEEENQTRQILQSHSILLNGTDMLMKISVVGSCRLLYAVVPGTYIHRVRRAAVKWLCCS